MISDKIFISSYASAVHDNIMNIINYALTLAATTAFSFSTGSSNIFVFLNMIMQQCWNDFYRKTAIHNSGTAQGHVHLGWYSFDWQQFN